MTTFGNVPQPVGLFLFRQYHEKTNAEKLQKMESSPRASTGVEIVPTPRGILLNILGIYEGEIQQENKQ